MDAEYAFRKMKVTGDRMISLMTAARKYTGRTAAVILAFTALYSFQPVYASARTVDLNSLDVSVEAPEESSEDTSDIRYAVSLGADLNDSERAQVLKSLGYDGTEPDPACTVTVTNEEEHRYLDGYIDTAKTGTRSLTSVKLTLAEAGHGIIVHTENIDYCTEGMYRNALMTAGVRDADVYIASPCASSGTAGIIGALKAYGKASGNEISDDAIDTAVSEMTVTGQIEDDQERPEEKADSEAVIVWLKTQLADGSVDADDKDSVSDFIQKGVDRFGLNLSSGDKDILGDLVTKWNSLGLDSEYIKQQAENIYRSYGEDVLEKANRDIDSKVKKSAGEFMKNMLDSLGSSISSFFHDLFLGK